MAGSQRLSVPPWKQGEDAALALRHRLRLGDAPVNIWDVARQAGALVALHDFGADAADGMYLHKAGRALILVNADRRASRQRFTAAHELGHHEMHRHGRPTLLIQDQDIFGKPKDPIEKAANAFAASLLAPTSALTEALGGKRNKQVTPDDVIALMGRFGMSYEATCNQLSNAGLVNRPARKALLDAAAGDVERMLSNAGIDDEALFPYKDPLPSGYVEQVRRLWEHRFISEPRFAEMLRLTEDEAREWRERHGLSRPDVPDYDAEAADKLLEELR